MANIVDNDQYEQCKAMAFDGNSVPLLSAIDNDSSLLNIRDVWGYTIIHWLARYGKTELIDELSNRGEDINALHPKGWNALMFAAEKNKIETATYLISKGADLNATNQSGQTALKLYGCRSEEHISIEQKDACRKILQAAFDNGPLVLQRKQEANWARRKYFILTLAGCMFLPLSFRKEIFTDFSAHIAPIVLDTPEKKRQYLLIQVFSNEDLVRLIGKYL
jgi:hypothetical protein